MRTLKLVVGLLIINCRLAVLPCKAQDTLSAFEFAPTLNTSRLDAIRYSTLAAYPLSMYWLYTQWYESYPRESFHFFNDATEWEGMDKAGHVMTTYNISGGYAGLLRWSGVERRKAAWIGTAVGFAFQSTIEVFDGFSSQWGFSVSDMEANLAGSFLFMGQEMLWNEQRIQLKYSFHQTGYAQHRPNLLGKSLAENWLKDYNGQTYWASLNLSSFMNKESCFPKWLAIAGGFGAQGMTGGKSNPVVLNGEVQPVFDRYRQYYIALDISPDKIRTNSKVLHALGQVLSIIKFPAPAIEFNEGHGTKFYWLYF